MIQLPDGFDVAQLISDFISLASPFVPLILLASAAMILSKTMKRL